MRAWARSTSARTALISLSLRVPTPRTSSSSCYALLAALAACGRIDFEPVGGDGAVPPGDAPAACLASQLGAPRAITLPDVPTTTAVGDLDRDGKADLVVHYGTAVGVLRGHGDGTFDAPVPYPAGDGACNQASESIA